MHLSVLALGPFLFGTLFCLRAAPAEAPTAPTAVATPVAPSAAVDPARLVKASGVIKPQVGAEVRVGSQLSGVVRRLHVQVGDTVAAGQRLAELDDRELLALHAKAVADHRLALAELHYAAANLERQRAIAAARAISAGDLDMAERAHAVAGQQVAAAQAAVDYAQIQLDRAIITAPIGGVVASVATQEGETVSASFSAPTFVTLIDLRRLEVWAYVDETDIGRIEPGQHATFTVDTYGAEEFSGAVTAIYPKAEIRDNVVNYIVVLRFEPRAGRTLRPEMTAIVRIAPSPTSGDTLASRPDRTPVSP
ncbi:MAG TPA: efflux RND transporter periplasmic adaptor subunit [Opitutaceae bacterium]|nr:efflux RND transporter periplasmic adaptor subunit [Opitutaceae bacterium]